MKKALILLGLTLGGLSCQTTEPLTPVSVTNSTDTNKPIQQFDPTGQTSVAEGNFMSNVHPTSGSVKLYQKAGKYTLVFENFKTDSGPDLRIYLSEDKVASKYVEISNKVNVGNYYVELPANADPKTQKYVLIWCKQFSVLFGNAALSL